MTERYLDASDRYRPAARFAAFGLAVVLSVGTLGTRLLYLELSAVDRPPISADAATPGTLTRIGSTRGLIYDRNGVALVENVPVYALTVTPADLPLPKRDEVVARLSFLTGVPGADIYTALDASTSRFDAVRLPGTVSKSVADLVAESRSELPGVRILVESRRSYPAGTLVSQIVGYTARISGPQLQSDAGATYEPNDTLGVAGVEATYEVALRGIPGEEREERDATGRPTRDPELVSPPAAGASLRLTIDTRDQRLAQQALEWGMRAAGLKRGVVIVMNPQTGEVLALVSLPTYDNNAFAAGITTADFQRLARDPTKPLTNHAIQSQFPPGSTYKLVTGSGGLADGKIKPTTRLTTRPFLTLGASRFYDWNRRGFGACDIRCGFAHSSDTFFFQVAAMLGIDRLAYWAREFGFGEKTGIDLPGEVRGIVPSEQWKLDSKGLPIYPGEVYQAGIGQGYDAVTPIQLITAYAALANGGKVMQPQVVRDITTADGRVVRPFEPHVVRQLPLPAAVLTEMRQAARNVVLVRHTYNLVDLPIIVAGKSGTAEFGVRDAKGRLPFHSWFVGFVPAQPRVQPGDPKGLKAVSRPDSNLVVLAFAYDSRTKGNTATEIAKYFLQLHFGIRKDYRIPNLLHRDNFYQGN